jgi:hypothetical protein
MVFLWLLEQQRSRRETAEKPRETPKKPGETQRNHREKNQEKPSQRERKGFLHISAYIRLHPSLLSSSVFSQLKGDGSPSRRSTHTNLVVNSLSLRTHVWLGGENGFLVVVAAPPTGKTPTGRLDISSSPTTPISV